MSLGDQLIVFALRAAQANSRKTLTKDLLDFLKHAGGEWFVCTYLRRGTHGFTIERSIGNLPEGFQKSYLENGYEAYDPVFQIVVQAGGHGYWGDLTRRTPLSRKQQEVMDHAASWGMANGFTRRVMLDHGGMVVMMISGRRLKESADVAAALRLACEVFASEGLRMLNSTSLMAPEPPPAKLSRKQLQVLALRAAGLSNQQVAAQMSTVPKTIESHVTEIKKRLKAKNMIDAVQIAQRMRLIPR